MRKYLRHILSNDDEPAIAAVLGDNTAHLAWMYEPYATPYSTGGIQKLSVGCTADATAVGPLEEFLGVLTVWEFCGIEFHYPRAERGDPHGEYNLGREYFDGGLQHFGRARGLALIRSAAAKGYEHAVVFLNRLRPAGDGPPGEPSDD